MCDLLEKTDQSRLTPDQKKQYNKVKHDLELYREIILSLHSVLKWEKKVFPGIIFIAVTISFLIVWYLNMSILTSISVDLLLLTLIDYGFPIVSKFIYKSENWTGVEEKKFETVCHEVLGVMDKIAAGYKSFFHAKEEKSTMYLVLVTIILVVLAWLGSTFDNMFLAYLTVLSLMMYPGLSHHGIVAKAKDTISSFAGSHLKNIMPKSKESKND